MAEKGIKETVNKGITRYFVPKDGKLAEVTKEQLAAPPVRKQKAEGARPAPDKK